MMTDSQRPHSADTGSDLAEQAVNRAFIAMEQPENDTHRLGATQTAAKPADRQADARHIFDELLGALSTLKTTAAQTETVSDGIDNTVQEKTVSDGIDHTVREKTVSDGISNTVQEKTVSDDISNAVQEKTVSDGIDNTVQEKTVSDGIDNTVQEKTVSDGISNTQSAVSSVRPHSKQFVTVQPEQTKRQFVAVQATAEPLPEVMPSAAEISAVTEHATPEPDESAPPSATTVAADFDEPDVEESTEFLYRNEFRSKREWLLIVADKTKLLIILDTLLIVVLLIAGVVFWQMIETPLPIWAPFALFAATCLISLGFAIRAASLNAADRAVFSSEKYWETLNGSADDVRKIHDYLQQELMRLDTAADRQIRVINTAYAVFYLGLQLGVWTFVAIRFIFNR